MTATVTRWSAAALSAWGKTESDGPRVLPLVRHLEDTAAVAAVLWDRWLPDSVKRRIGAALPEGERDGRILYIFEAGIHDVGKLSPAFACLIDRDAVHNHALDAMAREGLSMPVRTEQRLPSHSLISQYLIQEWLCGQWRDLPLRVARRRARAFASPVGAHHGVPVGAQHLSDLDRDPRRHVRPTTAWADAQAEVLTTMARLAGALDRLQAWSQVTLPLTVQLELAGAIVVADWLASDQRRFPFDDSQTSQERADAAVSGWELPAPWRATTSPDDLPDLFASRFAAIARQGIRPVQAAAAAAAAELSRPGLLVIEASTGEGKTEGALLAAEVLAARFGLGGVMFALPTQATSDGLFPRFHAWVRTLGMPVTSIFLAHGKANLNEDYRRLGRHGHIAGVGDPTEDETTRALVTSWLRGRRRGVLANFVVGTIDQVLFAALSAKFVQLRQLAMTGKVVVIDEVHAADNFMRVFLRRALTWFAAQGTPVVLLSATLPPDIRAELVGAYAAGLGMAMPAIEPSLAYPRLTVLDESVRVIDVVATPGRETNVRIEFSDDWFERVCQSVDSGGCVAVVHNTVARAQDSYDALLDRLGAERVMLVHSRFLSVARMAREHLLRDLLGPPGRPEAPDRPHGFVVVGTQVLEQSLDIDVDIMVTDLAPIDLVLQRAGRVHRHRRPVEARPPSLRNPTVLVTGMTPAADGPPDFDRGSRSIYGEAALLRSAAVLAPLFAGTPLRFPDDLPRLVAAGYDRSAPVPPGWEERWEAGCRAQAKQLSAQEEDAKTFLLPGPGEQETMVGLTDRRGDEPDDDGSAASRARVRDTDDTLEVVVIRRDGGVLRPMPEAGLPPGTVLPTELDCPDDIVAGRLAVCTLTLPGAITPPWADRKGVAAIDRVIRELERQGAALQGWSQSPWLKGSLVLVLDESLHARLDGWDLYYDPDRGLRHTKERKESDA